MSVKRAAEIRQPDLLILSAYRIRFVFFSLATIVIRCRWFHELPLRYHSPFL